MFIVLQASKLTSILTHQQCLAVHFSILYHYEPPNLNKYWFIPVVFGLFQCLVRAERQSARMSKITNDCLTIEFQREGGGWRRLPSVFGQKIVHCCLRNTLAYLFTHLFTTRWRHHEIFCIIK